MSSCPLHMSAICKGASICLRRFARVSASVFFSSPGLKAIISMCLSSLPSFLVALYRKVRSLPGLVPVATASPPASMMLKASIARSVTNTGFPAVIIRSVFICRLLRSSLLRSASSSSEVKKRRLIASLILQFISR